MTLNTYETHHWGRTVMKWLTLFLLNMTSAVCFLAATLMIKLRLRREPDPWRRTVGTGLRSEASKFGLSAFGVKTGSLWTAERFSRVEEDFAKRFALFLRSEPSARFALRHDRFCCHRVVHQRAETTLAEFSPWGELRSILPILDESDPVPLNSSERGEVERLIVEEFNQTRQLPEFARARILTGNVVRRWFDARKPDRVRSNGAAYGERLLKSCCLSFETVGIDRDKRFEPPDFRIRRIIGAGFLNVVCRRAPNDAMDIWIQIHHTGGDGAPMQEFLSRLETNWGTQPGILFPSDPGRPPKILPCFASTEERPLHLISDFIDFSALSQLRNDLKTRFAKEGIEAIPVGALLNWCLAHQPEFQGVRFANAVDVPANETEGRGVDLVPIRPADYMDQRGFAAYLSDFNQLVLDARNRRTRSYRAMRNLSVLPPMVASAALRLNPEAGRSTFGTVGVSIVKSAKVVVGTMADQGFDGGFILIGNMSLPSRNGRTSAAVSIKGEYAAIRGYPMAIRRAIQMASRLEY
jgi:hypothetical protein